MSPGLVAHGLLSNTLEFHANAFSPPASRLLLASALLQEVLLLHNQKMTYRSVSATLGKRSTKIMSCRLLVILHVPCHWCQLLSRHCNATLVQVDADDPGSRGARCHYMRAQQGLQRGYTAASPLLGRLCPIAIQPLLRRAVAAADVGPVLAAAAGAPPDLGGSARGSRLCDSHSGCSGRGSHCCSRGCICRQHARDDHAACSWKPAWTKSQEDAEYMRLSAKQWWPYFSSDMPHHSGETSRLAVLENP